MADGSEEVGEKQKKEIAKWFLTNAPAGEIQYVAKDVRTILEDDAIYEMAAAEAFPVYNKAHLIVLEMPDRSGDVIITTYGELDECNYLDPRTAQVATVDHVKQVCTKVRPANDDELPSSYIEEFRVTGSKHAIRFIQENKIFREKETKAWFEISVKLSAPTCWIGIWSIDASDIGFLDDELCKYVGEAYPKGTCSVYCTKGKDVEGPGADFELAVVISASRFSPQNYCNGSWRSIWNIEFKDDLQAVELRGKLQVGAHYFEEGNVQLDANNECKDSTIFQPAEDCAITIATMIRHHEAEYLSSLEASYINLSDTTFKDLRRKLPVTRTLFPWHSTMQFSLNRDISKELGIGK